jgi:hypothetical protein
MKMLSCILDIQKIKHTTFNNIQKQIFTEITPNHQIPIVHELHSMSFLCFFAPCIVI